MDASSIKLHKIVSRSMTIQRSRSPMLFTHKSALMDFLFFWTVKKKFQKKILSRWSKKKSQFDHWTILNMIRFWKKKKNVFFANTFSNSDGKIQLLDGTYNRLLEFCEMWLKTMYHLRWRGPSFARIMKSIWLKRKFKTKHSPERLHLYARC